jgi:outer membrane murein-binding lipoprotein Lpp
MSAVCLWCESEARARPRQAPGLCLVHRFEAVMRRAEAGPESAFLIVVARNEGPLFHRLSEWFLEDARVRVIVDRRRAERRQRAEYAASERRQRERRELPPDVDDLRHHPAVMLSVLSGGVHDTVPSDGGEREDPDRMELAELRERLERWVRESREMADYVLPVLYRRTELVRDRAEIAERDGRKLAAHVAELETEVTRLRAEIHQLKRERDTFAENVEQAVTEMARMTSRFTARTRSD